MNYFREKVSYMFDRFLNTVLHLYNLDLVQTEHFSPYEQPFNFKMIEHNKRVKLSSKTSRNQVQ